MELPADLGASDVRFLPIVAAFARRLRLMETINHLVPSEMDVDPGRLTLCMVLDALAGRHPLYRIGKGPGRDVRGPGRDVRGLDGTSVLFVFY